MKSKDIINFMENWAPLELAEDWDNSGIQIGREDKDIRKILLALDYDEKVYNLAKEKNIDMIITHHPFIFSKINKITNKDYLGSLIMRTIVQDLVVYSSHTNLDKAEGGVNYKLAEIFKIKNSEVLEETNTIEDEVYGYGQVGDIEEVSLKEYIGIIKDNLGAPKVTVWGDVERNVNRVALIGGSGASFIKAAKEKNADILITGDIKYHDAQLADQLGITVIDAGHYYTEKVILPRIEEKILKLDSNLDVIIYNESSPKYNIY